MGQEKNTSNNSQLELMSVTAHMPLETIIKRGETLQVEFKDDRVGFSDSSIHEAVVAMTNTEGGVLLIGITDNGEIVGSKRVDGGYWKSPESLAGAILANTVPACATAVTFEQVLDQKIAVVRIPKSPSTTGTKGGKFLKRVLDAHGKPQNIPMTTDDILSGISRVGVQDFSSTVLSDSSLDEIDFDLVSRVSRHRAALVQDSGLRELLTQSPERVLHGVGLLGFNNRKPTIACVLMFGHEAVIRGRFPNHEIQYQVLGKRGEPLKNQSFTGPITQIFTNLLQLPELMSNSDEFIFHGNNVVIPEYPEESRREALANAIVHRDYTLQAGIQIQSLEGQLIITSPGAFPSGVTISNLLSVPPTPRNRRLAEAMKVFGLVESSGRGIDYIFEGQAKFGRPAPDYTATDHFRVSVRLVGGKANLDFCKFILSTVPNPTISELLILNSLFFRRDLTADEAGSVIQKPMSIAHEILFKLHKDGLVEVSAEKVPKFLLKGSLHHSVRKAVKPTRMNKSQMTKFKAALTQELRRRSPNSISNLSDVVGLSPPQARRLLVQLKNEGIITMLPTKRWSIKK